jgi:GGDEF domain-containing protein
MQALLEVSIWSAMTGMVLLLMLAAATELALQRSLSAARGLAFIVLTGGAAVLQSGLPEMLLPGAHDGVFLLEVASGPLAGALALSYLGIWSGTARDEALIRRIVSFGPVALIVAAVSLVAVCIVEKDAPSGRGDQDNLMTLAAGITASAVLMAGVVALRAVTLGDPLARWMAAACVCLAGMVAGLYAKALQLTGYGVLEWALTAACTVAYLLIVIVLTIWRNRELRKLARQAKGVANDNWNKLLPGGAALVRLVDDALWRSARVGRDCLVAAVTVNNLYASELEGAAGLGAEGKIIEVMAARIRRIVGFRNVVGLYHPRCFILVVSAVQDPKRGHLVASRLLKSLRLPLLLGTTGTPYHFAPTIGMGILRIDDASSNPLDAMNKAEQMALEAAASDSGVVMHDIASGFEL